MKVARIPWLDETQAEVKDVLHCGLRTCSGTLILTAVCYPAKVFGCLVVW
jgi:hypothetical protein